MGESAERIAEGESFEELIDYLGRLLAEEYVTLMRKGEQDESSNLCSLFERESAAGEY